MPVSPFADFTEKPLGDFRGLDGKCAHVYGMDGDIIWTVNGVGIIIEWIAHGKRARGNSDHVRRGVCVFRPERKPQPSRATVVPVLAGIPDDVPVSARRHAEPEAAVVARTTERGYPAGRRMIRAEQDVVIRGHGQGDANHGAVVVCKVVVYVNQLGICIPLGDADVGN